MKNNEFDVTPWYMKISNALKGKNTRIYMNKWNGYTRMVEEK